LFSSVAPSVTWQKVQPFASFVAYSGLAYDGVKPVHNKPAVRIATGIMFLKSFDIVSYFLSQLDCNCIASTNA
jgi:hypothetical protein